MHQLKNADRNETASLRAAGPRSEAALMMGRTSPCCVMVLIGRSRQMGKMFLSAHFFRLASVRSFMVSGSIKYAFQHSPNVGSVSVISGTVGGEGMSAAIAVAASGTRACNWA